MIIPKGRLKHNHRFFRVLKAKGRLKISDGLSTKNARFI
ncbi:hypothetical protein l13_19280 [Neisseria weaveri ATCC 51223]|nr:hypothetical protein l13_19280 [Neisseria weaveri ATCC 51223]